MKASEPAVWMMLLSLVAVSAAASPTSRYEDLVSLFKDWRAFQKPKLIAATGVPDYGAAAMAAQQKELEAYQKRLAAIDSSGWPIPQQVDYQIVRAEMNGLDFDHRVLKPWVNNPGFYVTVFSEESDQPAREGPYALGAIELWSYSFPLSPKDAAEIAPRLRAIPGLLSQAKTNLTGSGRDLWIYGTKAVRQQSKDLEALSGKLGGGGARNDVEKARKATDELAAWLDAQAPSKKAPSGIGVENYDWYLQNVQLVPYTWSQEVALMERELARSQALLAMEELKNAKLPPQSVVSSAEEFDRRFAAGVTDYMGFLKDHEILTVKDYMDPALRARLGRYGPPPHEFFTEVDYRDPEVMRTHGYHWFDKAIVAHEAPASPIRAEVLLYNMFNTRTEGHATGWEELMMQAGMFDKDPRSRELIYILVAERAARALGELFLQSNRMTLEEASAFACARTPRGWLSMNGDLVRSEQHLYLQQPGYGTSYLIGKIEIEKLIDDRRRQLGNSFRMKAFMDDFNARGLIPASLLRWEMTGEKSPELQGMLK